MGHAICKCWRTQQHETGDALGVRRRKRCTQVRTGMGAGAVTVPCAERLHH